MSSKRVFQPFLDHSLGEVLIQNLSSNRWIEFRAAVAFVKYSGVQFISAPLSEFLSRDGRKSRVTVGVDMHGTSVEGLTELLAASENGGEVYVFHDDAAHRPTFHPKIFLFRSEEVALAIVGSGNLTRSGLFTNYEAAVALELDCSDPNDQNLLTDIETALDCWSDVSQDTVLKLDEEKISSLIADGLVVYENNSDGSDQHADNDVSDISKSLSREITFGSNGLPNVPVPGTTHTKSQRVGKRSKKKQQKNPDVAVDHVSEHVYVMTLQRTDVGVGQTTAGTSRRSPEIFIPLAARDAVPEFWGWDGEFTEDPSKPGKFDRNQVRMLIDSKVVEVNMMTWPDKSDFRLRCEALRSAGEIGDIIRIETVGNQKLLYDYRVDILSQGTDVFKEIEKRCVIAVRNSKKRFGYYRS